MGTITHEDTFTAAVGSNTEIPSHNAAERWHKISKIYYARKQTITLINNNSAIGRYIFIDLAVP